MTFSEVKQLLDAGFTKDEIMSFNQPITVNPNIPGMEAENNSEKVAELMPDPVPVGSDTAAETSENPNIPESAALDQLNGNIEKLIRVMQTSNLQTAYTDKPSEEDITKKVDRIMQAIIRPDLTKGGTDK